MPDADAVLLRIVYLAVRDFDHLTAKEILTRAQEAEPNSFSRWTAKAVWQSFAAATVSRPTKRMDGGSSVPRWPRSSG